MVDIIFPSNTKYSFISEDILYLYCNGFVDNVIFEEIAVLNVDFFEDYCIDCPLYHDHQKVEELTSILDELHNSIGYAERNGCYDEVIAVANSSASVMQDYIDSLTTCGSIYNDYCIENYETSEEGYDGLLNIPDHVIGIDLKNPYDETSFLIYNVDINDSNLELSRWHFPNLYSTNYVCLGDNKYDISDVESKSKKIRLDLRYSYYWSAPFNADTVNESQYRNMLKSLDANTYNMDGDYVTILDNVINCDEIIMTLSPDIKYYYNITKKLKLDEENIKVEFDYIDPNQLSLLV